MPAARMPACGVMKRTWQLAPVLWVLNVRNASPARLLHYYTAWPSTCSSDRCTAERENNETQHKRSNRGRLHEVKGKVKETVGQAVNNPNLEKEGQAENLSGKVQKKVGQVEQVFEK